LQAARGSLDQSGIGKQTNKQDSYQLSDLHFTEGLQHPLGGLFKNPPHPH